MVLSLISTLTVVGFLVYKKYDEEKKKLIHEEQCTMTATESVACASLRVAVAELKLYSFSSSFSREGQMRLLQEWVKRANSNNEWFNKNKGYFYINTADTSEMEVIMISDGFYTAKIHYKGKVLKKYTFTAETIKGYEIYVSNDN